MENRRTTPLTRGARSNDRREIIYEIDQLRGIVLREITDSEIVVSFDRLEWKGHRMCRACRGHAERISDDSGTFAPPSRRASAGGRL